MKGFMINNGDLVIDNNEITVVNDAELIRQTIETVLATNKGEWLFNDEEGIEFDLILGIKEIDHDVIKSIIQEALEQVDSGLSVDEFSCEYEKETRNLCVSFKAKKDDGETVEVSTKWD